MAVHVGKKLKTWKIYSIFCQTSGKYYVGQTSSSVPKRWACHLQDAKRGRSWLFSRAIRAHGRDAFVVKEICRCSTQADANRIERETIDSYGCMTPHGYNVLTGGSQCEKPLSVRIKISLAKKGHHYGPFSDEHKEKLRLARFNRKHSPETKAKMSANGKKLPNLVRLAEMQRKAREGNLGSKASEATKEKMRFARNTDAYKAKRRILTPEQVVWVKKVCLPRSKFYGVEALASKLEVSVSVINRALVGNYD